MAGHSKWANIQHRKGKQDAKRGKIFTRLIREITVAVKQGGNPEPEHNPRLRAAIDNALSNNMTRDTIEKAIKKAAGANEADNLEEIRYEGYGPAGVAIMVDCMTDNRNRTAGEIRHAFSKGGGNLGTDGSVAYLFSKKGQLIFSPGTSEESILEIALDAGAEDVVTNDDESIEVLTDPNEFEAVKTALEKADLKPVNAEITYLPSTYADLDEATTEKVMKLIDMFEELDDVQNVYTNV